MSPLGKALLLAFVLALTLGVGVFTYYYVKFSRIIDARLRTGVFSNTSLIYSAPRPIFLGDQARGEEIAAYLRSCQYSESNTSRAGWYRLRADAIEINPGPDAYEQEGAVIKILGGRVTEIISLRDHSERNQYFLEPELVTNVFDRKREKRRMVRYDDIPPVMVNAVLSAEDKHFFQHAGFDPFRIVRAGFKYVFGGRLEGASTLTMQLARTLWLSNERTWRRKLPEILITIHLEQKLTKKQIFEDYANSIYLGNHGSFSINGFGEGAQFYFGKDLSQVNLQEAAFLAGLPQNSSMRDPFRYPDRAKARRNIVLGLMRENGKITERQYQEAAASELKVMRGTLETSDAPYFVDLVNEDLQNRFQDSDFANKSYRVYTTLDMDLQRDAVEAVRTGIVETDNQWKRKSKRYGTDEFPLAQVALIALDTETGKVLALVGGRNYGASQLNHAIAKRQPGSSFKPFVYTAAMETGLNNNGGLLLTPATTVVDEPTTFYFQNITYTPNNFEEEYMGTVTLRTALAHSLNISAVKVAQMVGYDTVAHLAHRVGLKDIKPTPSIALGAYEVMPLEIASAYTVFPNGGKLLPATFIDSIRDQQSKTIYESHPQAKQVLDPRVTYLVEQMMEEVMRTGTAMGVHARKFNLPAAGKTGTSRDGWFAGFTSKILCVVWIGFDDNRDFKLQGARSALPIWVEFMKRAHQHSAYRNVHAFNPPEGIVTEEVDADTGEVATARCPHVRSEVFIAGTQPVQICRLHGGSGGATQVSGWEPVQPQPVAEAGSSESTANAPVVASAQTSGSRPVRSIPITPTPQPEEEKEQKKGFWQKLRNVFRH